MPATTRVRAMVLSLAGGALVATMLGLPGPAAASDADRPALPPPPSYTAQQLVDRAEELDAGNPGYHYAVAHTEVLPTEAEGLRAVMSVHRPGDVRGRIGQHSVGQMAVGHTADSSYLEAGWRQFDDGPRLFVYWRPADGRDTCYNVGCGFRPKGPGLRPGVRLVPESEISIAFQHQGNRWWLKIDGKRSGYFPDDLWDGKFQGTDFAQLYGEVFAEEWQGVCPDMGNGRPARNPGAAYMRDAEWIGGPRLRLHRADSVREVHDYGFRRTSSNSFRYGGPGEC